MIITFLKGFVRLLLQIGPLVPFVVSPREIFGQGGLIGKVRKADRVQNSKKKLLGN